jgi:hypothetical protein
MIEDFGARVASIWSELRPTTRGLVERALKTPNASLAPGRNLPYDARADLELSRLLAALDERAAETKSTPLTKSEDKQLRHLAETCAAVLQEKTQSAEVFTQLIGRASARRDYARVDALADVLTRFAPSEICELARSEDVVVRALANEALAQCPTGVLFNLLGDPVDSEIARQALRRQAIEFGSEEARRIVTIWDQSEGGVEEFQ